MSFLKLPLGIDRFEKLRGDNYFYVDKTGLIPDLLQQEFEVRLFTRPRRFGKTLTMSMLANFFDVRKDSKGIFTGLQVCAHHELCAAWMNQYPVLFLSFKDVESVDFKGAYGLLQYVIAKLCKEHAYLEGSARVDPTDQEIFLRIKKQQGDSTDTKTALDTLMRMMYAHYTKPVILLIDEYDVPLAKASENGYYLEMLDVMRSLLGLALKTNPALKFAVVTGCLRIAKESIFTGTNNLVANSIMDTAFSNSFGFTKGEVNTLLKSAGLIGHAPAIQKWYDGYRFGNQEIYCPWDLLCYVAALQQDAGAIPVNYWENTSHNGIIRSFIDRTDLAVNRKFELLLNGGYITEAVTDNLTYDMLHASEENLWSVLYLTGYLTITDMEPAEKGKVCLKIPNSEIESIFEKTVVQWFSEKVKPVVRSQLFGAMWRGDAEHASQILSDLLFQTISYHDYHEDYYHAFLTGIFAGAGYPTQSNREHGLGRPDIVIWDDANRSAILIEAKRVDRASALEAGCDAALAQIKAERYAKDFLDGYRTIRCYGIAFYKKSCLLKML